MAELTSNQFTLGTGVITQIVPFHNAPQMVTIHNQEKNSNRYIFLGGTSVSEANGIHIDQAETQNYTLLPGATMWATTNYNGLKCGVIRQTF
jgi:hypothetical protein